MSAVQAEERPPGALAAGALRLALPRTLPKLAFVAAAVAAWQLWAGAGNLGAVPTPVEVTVALVGIVADGSVWSPLGVTLSAWAISFVIASAMGLVVGFVLGASRLAYRLSVFVLDFCRTIPALGLVPLVVLMFGARMQSTIVLAVFGAVWAVLLQTIYGVRDVDPVARDAFRSSLARRRDVVIRLVLPSAAPYIATGLRLAAAVCLLLTLSAQIVIPSPGIGQQIVLTQLGGAIPKMYAYIVLSGVVGVAINAAFVALERIVLHWHPAHRKAIR
ncbi:ABC transporter permease [Microbacterium album]|uniref:Nitrate ABC transporter permease n=1 Tax=Microbacterium album TaxID=2053191 RepID=A0A917IBH3_9MICO|nr:ABC transporter permease subunit [Microbacterium album]GGH33507.1 nitrate ABC transporter permease [Microbacterium album]